MPDKEKHFRKTWNTALAGVIASLDAPSFERNLIDALKTVAVADSSVIFIYQNGKKPEAKFVDCQKEYREFLVDRYLDGYFVLDPFYIACCDGIEPGVYTLKDLAPNRFRFSEYYKVYYSTSRIADEVCFILPGFDDCRAVVSLTRMRPKGSFTKEEIGGLAETAPIVNALVLRAWKEHPKLSVNASAEENLPSNIELLFASFMHRVLSPRERQVAAMILRGYSSVAIGAELAIAEATVKANRRSIYAKLGISSQAELFALFIRQLQSSGTYPILRAAVRQYPA